MTTKKQIDGDSLYVALSSSLAIEPTTIDISLADTIVNLWQNDNLQWIVDFIADDGQVIDSYYTTADSVDEYMMTDESDILITGQHDIAESEVYYNT